MNQSYLFLSSFLTRDCFLKSIYFKYTFKKVWKEQTKISTAHKYKYHGQGNRNTIMYHEVEYILIVPTKGKQNSVQYNFLMLISSVLKTTSSVVGVN